MQKENLLSKYKNYIPYIIVMVGVILTGVIYLVSMNLLEEQDGMSLENTKEETIDFSVQSDIMVYVCGAVTNPGVYRLAENSRIVDAIEAAGGFTEDAWREGINLAQIVMDAQQIYVMTEEERILDNVSNADTSSSKINLNTATKEQLMELPSIGEAKAESIIAYRQQNGAFSSIEDIMKISGIKESVFQKIKDFITV